MLLRAAMDGMYRTARLHLTWLDRTGQVSTFKGVKKLIHLSNITGWFLLLA